MKKRNDRPLIWKELGMSFDTFLRTFYEVTENGDLILNKRKFVNYYNEHRK